MPNPATTATRTGTNGHHAGGISTVEPPPKRTRPAAFTAEELDLAATLLKRGQWVSDRRQYRTRAAAAHRADSLKKALAAAGLDAGQLRRRTWPGQSRRYLWALKLDRRKEVKRRPS